MSLRNLQRRFLGLVGRLSLGWWSPTRWVASGLIIQTKAPSLLYTLLHSNLLRSTLLRSILCSTVPYGTTLYWYVFLMCLCQDRFYAMWYVDWDAVKGDVFWGRGGGIDTRGSYKVFPSRLSLEKVAGTCDVPKHCKAIREAQKRYPSCTNRVWEQEHLRGLTCSWPSRLVRFWWQCAKEICHVILSPAESICLLFAFFQLFCRVAGVANDLRRIT